MKLLLMTALCCSASLAFAGDTKDSSGQYTIKDVQISFEGDDTEAPPTLKADPSPAPKAKGKQKPAAKKKAAPTTPKK